MAAAPPDGGRICELLREEREQERASSSKRPCCYDGCAPLETVLPFGLSTPPSSAETQVNVPPTATAGTDARPTARALSMSTASRDLFPGGSCRRAVVDGWLSACEAQVRGEGARWGSGAAKQQRRLDRRRRAPRLRVRAQLAKSQYLRRAARRHAPRAPCLCVAVGSWVRDMRWQARELCFAPARSALTRHSRSLSLSLSFSLSFSFSSLAAKGLERSHSSKGNASCAFTTIRNGNTHCETYWELIVCE